jgi:hypothetical protein
MMHQRLPRLQRIDRIEHLAAQRGDDIFGKHLAHLVQVFAIDSGLIQDRLLEQIEVRLFERLRPIVMMTGLLITLGLIGTVVGLIALISNMGDLVAGNDAESMIVGIQAVLAGMGTAFYTTLLGAIFGGVALRLLNAVVESASLRFLADLAEITEIRVLPALRQVSRRLDRQRIERTASTVDTGTAS